MASGRKLELGEVGEIETTPQYRDEGGKWKRHPTGRGKGVERWRARAYYRGHDGVAGEASCVAATKREAIEALEARLAERSVVGDLDLKESTPFVQAGELWLARIARSDSGLSPRTVDDYTRTYRRYVEPRGSSVKGLTLAQVNDPQRLRQFLVAVADKHGTGAARMAKSVLSGILGMAVDSGVLTVNACRQVRPVKSQGAAKATARDTRRSLTRDERQHVIDYARALADEPDLWPATARKRRTTADLIAFMAGTGARVTEARLLLWDDVDLDKASVEVKGTKSSSAHRRVSLPGWLVEVLRKRVDWLTEAYFTEPTGFVFASPHLYDQGVAWDQSNAAAALSSVLKGAGVPWATPHTFRRTVATLLHEGGQPLVKIADQLGHSDPAMTARAYLGRDLLGDRSEVAALL